MMAMRWIDSLVLNNCFSSNKLMLNHNVALHSFNRRRTTFKLEDLLYFRSYPPILARRQFKASTLILCN